MSCFQLYYNACDRFNMDKLPVTTYSIPPYLLLRLTMGPRQETPLVRYWFSTDSRGGYGSRRLGVINTCSQEVQLQPGNKMYLKGGFLIFGGISKGGGFSGSAGAGKGGSFSSSGASSHVTITERKQSEDKKYQYCLSENNGVDISIHDKDGKTLVYDINSKKLIAKSLAGENVKLKAIFELSSCSLKEDNTSKKMPFTLKIKGINLYLCCSEEDKLTLQEKDKLTEKDKINEILFFMEYQNGYTTFRSATYPKSYICTNRYRENDPVTIKSDINRVRVEFVVKEEVGGQNQGQGSKVVVEHSAKGDQTYPSGPLGLPSYTDYLEINSSCTTCSADYLGIYTAIQKFRVT